MLDKFICIYIKETAISMLMYRFLQILPYVRLICICSVYVIYLYPINVLLFSDRLYFVL